jgi:hypothetical protein
MINGIDMRDFSFLLLGFNQRLIWLFLRENHALIEIKVRFRLVLLYFDNGLRFNIIEDFRILKQVKLNRNFVLNRRLWCFCSKKVFKKRILHHALRSLKK